MVTFDAVFDIGEAVQHFVTKEKFAVRFVTFGLAGCIYQCHPLHYVGRSNELFYFDEPELEAVTVGD